MIALVTGGTRGIGASISKTLSKNFQVIANYAENDDAAEKFSKENNIEIMKWNVSNYKLCQEQINYIENNIGPISVLVNNAGICHDAKLEDTTEEDWHSILDVNLTGIFNITKFVYSKMIKRKYGRIVNISSINGKNGRIGQTNYASSKAGILGFTKALAQEAGIYNITVNAVCPGYIETDMLMAVPVEVRNSLARQTVVGRLGKPEEIAQAVSYLVGPNSGFITGSTLDINGGQYLN
jgi:acetoacetyl-CoA reductase